VYPPLKPILRNPSPIDPPTGAVASAGGFAESGEGSGGRGSAKARVMVEEEVHRREQEERERRAQEHVPSRPSGADGQQENEKRKEKEERVVSDQHKTISGGVAGTAQRDADEPLPAVSSVIQVISSSLTPSKPGPDRDAQTHSDLQTHTDMRQTHTDMSGIQLHLSSRNAASTPGGRSATASSSSHLFQLPISDKASSSDPAHHPGM